MKFEIENRATFDIPEPVSYRQMLRYDSIVADNMDSVPPLERMWLAAQSVIDPDSWISDHLELSAGLDDPMTPKGYDVLRTVAIRVTNWMTALKEIPKN